MIIARASNGMTALLVTLLLGCQVQPPGSPRNAADDVARFVARREVCDHCRGEVPDPPNGEAMRDLDLAMKEHCTGTDADLAGLKAKYKLNDAVMAQLNAFEPRIEARSATEAFQNASGSTLDSWAGYYLMDSTRCTSPNEGAPCSTDFKDCLRIEPDQGRYRVELFSTQAYQHVCAFSITMRVENGMLVSDSPTGPVSIRRIGDRLVLDSSGIDPGPTGLGVCGAHADINSLAFPMTGKTATEARCFEGGM